MRKFKKHIENEIKALELEAIKGTFGEVRIVQLLETGEKDPLIKRGLFEQPQAESVYTNPVYIDLALSFLDQTAPGHEAPVVCTILATHSKGEHWDTVHFHVKTGPQKKHLILRIFLDQWIVDANGKLKKGNLLQRFIESEK